MKKLRLDLHKIEVESFGLPGTADHHESWHVSGGGPDCVPSYEVSCWWTGDPMQNCNPASVLNPCSDYPLYC